MRKMLPAIVMGVGAFLLTLGLLMKFYAYPRLAVVPLDQNTTQVVQDADATFFDADNVKPGSGELTTTARVIGNPTESERASEETGRDLAVWEMGQVSDNNGDNMPMAGSTETVVFDRNTGEAVNCCGESQDGQEVKHEGLVVKFPFDAKPVDTYTWWDGTLKKAFPVAYEGTDEIQGMKLLKYSQQVPLEKYTTMELPGSLFGGAENAPAVTADRFYSNERTFWVDPVTGVVIDREEKQHQEFRYDGKTLPALDTTSRFTPATVDENVAEYKTKSSLLKMVQTTLPWTLGILGLLLLLGGLLWSLMAGRSRRSGATADESLAYEGGDPVFGGSTGHEASAAGPRHAADDTTRPRGDLPDERR